MLHTYVKSVEFKSPKTLEKLFYFILFYFILFYFILFYF